ncbi:MAG: tRNA (N(6)-L-threonylcarbamoyladenosine(37)-C(2))-methylthiotransferase MtaB [Acidobacteria bacterium]|nr:tRNA (N(6)-L-threonylcarbamoyladenosine(37)-C(2))-methylthiotransferase MtaB [Acidobacteriota bacterium]
MWVRPPSAGQAACKAALLPLRALPTLTSGALRTPSPAVGGRTHASDWRVLHTSLSKRRARYYLQVGSFFVESFGCRATQADGAAIERDLLARGFTRRPDCHEATLAVVNTCTVTAAADQDARSAIRRIHRENPECRILVTGCYAQRAPEEISRIAGVTWVVGNSHKAAIADIAAAANGFVPVGALQAAGPQPVAKPAEMFVADIFAHTELQAAPIFAGDSGWERTRPTLKVQDGCNNRCSFCVIPFVRGRSRSLPLGRILGEVDAMVAAGYREIVLSGINLGRWGRDLEGDRRLRFPSLVRAVLERTGVEKLRISSVEPMDWNDELIELMAGAARVARHAHVPLQSGSDRILRLMHRKYRPWHYADRIRRIREAMPQAAIGADVMAGFPGESDADFEESYRFIAGLPFTYLHVFTYSARPGTAAASMPGHVHGAVARERTHRLRELAATKNRAFRQSLAGERLQAITLAKQDGQNSTRALTDNYVKLRLSGRHEANCWMQVEVTGLTEDGLEGKPAS